MPASSSIAASRLTIASRCASMRAPTAMVIERTVGIATGIAATVRIRVNCSVVISRSPRTSATVRMTIARAIAMTMR